MGLIVTSRVKIGEEFRNPGYRLTEEDMVGRNVEAMKRHGHVKFVDDDELDRSATRRSRPKARPADDDDDE